MKIDEFNVSEDCLNQLQALGFTTVEELAEFLEQQAIGVAVVDGKWSGKCFYEVKAQLKFFNLWTHELENFWPST